MEMEKSKSAGIVRTQHDTIIEGQTQKQRLDTTWVGTFSGGDTTPSVQNVERWKCSSAVAAITNFDNGQDGQTIKVLGHANTTIVHGTNIKTNTGANKTLNGSKVYTFTLFDNVWYEDE